MKSHQKKENWPIYWVVLIDLILLGAGLVIFALFHHVLPRDTLQTGIMLPEPAASQTTQTTKATSFATSVKETEAADPDDWHAQFKEQFADGPPSITDSSYRSANVAVTIEKLQKDDAVCYVADIYLSSVKQLRSAFAKGQYARNVADEVLNMAIENDAILAISGDYFGIRDEGLVIRNGQLYRDVLFQDTLILYYDGSMETVTAQQCDLDRILSEGAWQAWSFGPMLLDANGQPMTRFNSQVNPDNPRGAIGYYEPGHYCFVLVDGRQPGYSNGMTLQELSGLFYELGCQAAYNLDGGESAVMTFLGKVVNKPYKDGRKISDIIYVADIAPEGINP